MSEIPKKYRKFIWAIGIFFPLFMWYSLSKKDANYTIYKCKTKELELKGVITFVSHKANYMSASVNNYKKPFSLNIAETISSNFPKPHLFDIGDSLIKKAGSKEFIIKKDGKVAIYLLDCND